MIDAYLQAARISTELGFPWWLQVTHLVNFLFLGLLVRSGWEILAPIHGCIGAMTVSPAPSG